MKDGKVFITPNEWFVPIEKAYPELETEYNRLELDETLDISTRNARFAELILSWGAVVEEVRTIFEHKNDATIYIPTFSTAPIL